MKSNITLVLGATGATGMHLVNQLLIKGESVKVIIRSPEKVPDEWKTNTNLEIIKGSILEIPPTKMTSYVKNCRAVASCLGHNLNLKGIYGKPRKLVRDSVAFLCNSIKENKPAKPVKLVLMNTTGNRNKDLSEKYTFGEKIVSVVVTIKFLITSTLRSETLSKGRKFQFPKFVGGLTELATSSGFSAGEEEEEKLARSKGS